MKSVLFAMGMVLPALMAGPAETDALGKSFQNPPDSARPWVLWYWMDGQIDRGGITKDLESMARQGIGGVVLGDITHKEDEGAVKFLTPEWQELFSFTLHEAKRLGLTVSTCPSAGWCATGGPWIKPEDSQQVLVWSTTRATGPGPFTGKLPQPQVIEGYYRDVAVFAVPSDGEPLASLKEITATGAPGKQKAAQLVDGNPGTAVRFKGEATDPRPSLEIGFHKPVKLRGVNFEFADLPRFKTGKVQAAVAGAKFVDIAKFKLKTLASHGRVYRAEVPVRPTTTDRLRVLFNEEGGAYNGMVAEVELFGESYVPHWTAKSGAEVDAADAARTGEHSASGAIALDSVKILSERMAADGSLDWEVPGGGWTILRIGHTSRGATNRPATAGEGLETDKFRKDITKFHFDQYIGKMAEKNKDCPGVLNAMWVDSWETGYQNWSPVFVEEFKRRRGYDPIPYLPAMMGRAVGTAGLSERFLWDVRRTIADLCADNFLGALTEFGKPYGIGLWFQPINHHFMDGLQGVGRGTGAESNMHFNTRDKARDQYPREKFCVSAAHGYGQTVVHSEAATAFPPSGAFVETPASIRELANANFVTGINNHWIHVFLHQPWPRAVPGLSWMWGLQFQRNNTWWEKLRGWSAYMTRSQFLLRQGVPVVDIACFIGEAVPTEAGNMGSVPELKTLPAGIDYDVCNAEIILTRMSAKDGRIVLPDGMSYALLYLPPSVQEIRPAVLKKIRDLVSAGAALVGNRPDTSPSLENYPACDAEVKKLADELWGAVGTDAREGRKLGSGMVYSADSLKKALAARGVAGDFTFTSTQSEALIESYHRRTSEADIYFVANRKDQDMEAICSFRVGGKLPELWQPDTGCMEQAGAYKIADGRTSLPLRFDPHGSVFVVFGKPAPVKEAQGRNWPELRQVQEIDGPWNIAFQKDRGAPEKAAFDKLIPWNEHPDNGVKYFSGTAAYRTQFDWKPETRNLKPETRVFLDLGEVREVADVTLNGKNLGILWKTPFRMDITGIAKAGKNELSVEVVNLWVNRMIGDEVMYSDDMKFAPIGAGDWKGFGMSGGPPDWFDAWSQGKGPRPTGRVAFSTVKFFSAKDPLLPSGLLGPVRILTESEEARNTKPRKP